MDRLKKIIEASITEKIIIGVIVVNALALGLETSPWVDARIGGFLDVVDSVSLAIFVVELLARIAVYRLAFFKGPWNIFDFVVVSIALIPTADGLSVLRALRVLRVLRVISAVPSLRRVVGALLAALPGMGSIVVLMSLVYYVFSVMATKLFAADFPQWFGSIGESAYSLFQIMTLESWSMGIVRPVMEKHPYAWAFFVPFILSTTFTVLNLFIGIVVSAMQSEHEAELQDERDQMEAERQKIADEAEAARASTHEEMEALGESVRNLRQEIQELRGELQQARAAPPG